MICMSTVSFVSLRTHRNQSRRSTTPAMIMIISYVYIEYNIPIVIPYSCTQLRIRIIYTFIPIRIMLGTYT